MTPRENVHDIEAHIMRGIFITLPGISETDDQLHALTMPQYALDLQEKFSGAGSVSKK
jgi:hypothetical protein